MEACSVTSRTTGRTPGCAAARACSSRTLRAAANTTWPASARRTTVARPIPPDAPVSMMNREEAWPPRCALIYTPPVFGDLDRLSMRHRRPGELGRQGILPGVWRTAACTGPRPPRRRRARRGEGGAQAGPEDAHGVGGRKGGAPDHQAV